MMKHFIRVAMLLCGVTVALSALSLKTIEAKATPSSWQVSQNSSTSCGKWSVVPSPNGNAIPSGLSGVAAVSATDVWAVGGSGSQTAGAQTLIEHWNGTSWNVVTSPNPGSFYNHLSGVTAVSATNVWAVGYYANTTGATQTLIEHWNGTHWSVVTSPSPGSSNDLTSVAAVSGSSIWAAGYISTGSINQTLVERWNGTSWSVVTSPNVGKSPAYWAMTAVSATDVWAVGSYGTGTKFDVTLTEQWNGKQWSIVKSPSPGSSATQLEGVSAVSGTDVWAVGHADSNTLIEHYHC